MGNTDKHLMAQLVARARRLDLTVEEMAREVGMSKSWGIFLVAGKIKALRFRTRSRVLKVLGEL